MQVTVIGGGLAGSEAAWQLAEAGLEVRLLEMRPVRPTPVHLGGSLAELVCSNSLRAASLGNAVGLLKHEMEVLGSLIMRAAHAAAVPAGGALAVDRDIFAAAVTTAIEQHPRIVIERRELVELPVGPAIIATGPLTSPALHAALESLLGEGSLAFFDAIAPIVAADSLDHARLFRASRYDKGAGDDYLNAPMDKATYERFVAELLAAEKVPLRQFENEGPDAEGTKAAPATCPVGAPAAPVARYFEACLPIEVMAERGVDTLRFGPMKPVGLIDPATGHRPWAVVQLRQDDLAAEHWNLVGFQTKLTFAEQRRVFRMIPGLEHARFVRLGMIHRNTFINAPAHLDAHLRLATHLTLRLAGQLTGVEGYVESAATGLLAGRMLATELLATELPAGGPSPPPADTACGGLIRHLTERPARGFQPANISWGLIAHAGEHGRERNRARRRLLQAEHALRRIREWGEATAGAALGEPQLAPPLDRPAGSE